MHNNHYKNNCRVCGLGQGEEPWEDGKYPTYAICSCCGVEFGYGDEDKKACVFFRKFWLKEKNGEWAYPKEKPENWSLDKQLKQIPPEFRD